MTATETDDSTAVAVAAAPTTGRSKGSRLAHHPGLDGMRGAAVAAVLFFHGGFSWAKGGYLGVSTFFTLSGFLITGLLLAERDTNGRIALARFWERRFRRLLPALLVALGVVAVYAAVVADTDQLAALRADALATLGYVANWRFIVSDQSYADLFAAPSPVLHAWSLAIEEQFYVVFPLLAAGVLAVFRGRHRSLAGVLSILAVGSVVTSIALRDDHTRVYYGTDTRAAELLVGALLAVWVARPGRALATRRRPVLAVAGVVAGLATVLAWSRVDQSSNWLYAGGFGAYGLLSVAMVAAAIAPGPIRRICSTAPLRGLGLISYGVYLYHWPVFLWLSPGRTDLAPWPLFALRLVVTLAMAMASYRLVEQPVRRGAFPGWRAPALVPVAAAAVALAVVLTTIVPGPPGRLAAEEASSPIVATAPAASTAAFGFVRQVDPSDPLRVLLVGDSVSFDAEPGIVGALAATGVTVVEADNQLGFGLTSGTYDWRSSWAASVVSLKPELVVAMFGGWDEDVAAKQPDAYRALLDEAVGVLTAGGSRLLLIGLPISVDRDGTPWPRPSHDALAEVPARFPGRVAFLDADDAVSPGGRFVSHLDGPGGRERVRKLDGTHLCPAGAARIGRAVLDAVSAAWRLPAPSPSWRSGDWAVDRRYNDPPGACPD